MEEKNNQMSIKALRVNRGLTQSALAQKLGVSTKSVSDWENNRVPIKPVTVYAIAYVLKTNADDIRV